MNFRSIATLVVALLAFAGEAAAQTTTEKLGAMTLAELMNLDVVTVTRLPGSRLQSPASVFVLTSDDIRRSGATTLAEVLRLVPGVHVAQIDGNKWAIGIRGFTDRLSRAMLVLIDGRAVYSPLFAGTYWEVQDLPLGDVERIEVVRGPGGALWGANAVTGIINVIRKRAAASRGLGATVAAGTEDPAVVVARYGASHGALQYRVSGKIGLRDPQVDPRGLRYDDARLGQVGARADWENRRGGFTLQGDFYRGVIGQRDALVTYTPPQSQTLVTDDPLHGANVLFRWTAKPSNPRSARVQGYYDHTERSELVFGERQHVADVDYQEGRVAGRHELLWGAGYRLVRGFTSTSGTLVFTPPNRTDHLVTAFIQDEIPLIEDRLKVSGGLKAERNDYSGLEWQPNARLIWTVSPANAVSVSATRAIRTPSRVEVDFESGNLLNPAGPTFVRLLPNPDFASEEIVAYEASLVTMPHSKVFATLSVFRNQHDNVLSAELLPTFIETDAGGTRTIVPVTFGNGLEGYSYGAEATADVRLTPWLRATGAYSGLRFQLSKKPGSNDITQEARGEGGAPRHQVQLGATVRFPHNIVADWTFRYLSALPALNLPGYATSNLQIEWRVNDRLSLFAVGRNLHEDTHAEFNDGANGTIRIQRAGLIGLRWTR